MQVKELMEERIAKSKADLVILGGDFNAGPVEHEGIVSILRLFSVYELPIH